jgi:protein-disulfide isomerase-like protein with CxxC motif
MNAELFFIYDSHCPWSYACTQLVNEIAKSLPELKINFWHNAHYDGDNTVDEKQISAVKQASAVNFSSAYLDTLNETKDSTMAANVLAWADQKSPDSTLPLLNALQLSHFQEGDPITSVDEMTEILAQLKLSPPNKALTIEKLTKDAQFNIHEIFEIQEIINTKAIPALLLAVGENLILLNHNLYIDNPKAIVEAVTLELNKN